MCPFTSGPRHVPFVYFSLLLLTVLQMSPVSPSAPLTPCSFCMLLSVVLFVVEGAWVLVFDDAVKISAPQKPHPQNG